MTQPVIGICLPLADQIHAQTMTSIFGLDLPRPYCILDRRSVPVETARNDIVGRLLTDHAFDSITHLLWIDDDMVFTPNAARRLLAHDLPIVGGLCHGRRAPHYAPILIHYKDDVPYYQHDYPQGLVEVDATGGAFLLVKREVYEAIEKAFPKPGEGPFTDQGKGEDVAFCQRARDCGYKVFVDTTLEIGHIGEVVIDSTFARRNRLAEFNPWVDPATFKVPNGAPVASIIIPTYNQRPAWLRAAIASALQQTVPVEVIVVDDGSTPPVVPSDLEENPAPFGGPDNLRLIRLPENRGCFAALNAGIEEMRTDWFAFLSSDDLFHPKKIEKQLRMARALNARATFHGYELLGQGVFVPPAGWRSMEEQRKVLSVACAFNILTALVHTSVFDEVGVFDSTFQITADWEFMNRVGQKIFWHPLMEALATRRESTENFSTRYANDPQKRAQWLEEDARIREMYKVMP